MNFEDKLLEEMEYYCNYKCIHKGKTLDEIELDNGQDSIEVEYDGECTDCGRYIDFSGYISKNELLQDISVCNYCQLKNFIMQIRDIKLEG